MAKRMTFTIILLVLVFGGLLFWNIFKSHMMSKYILQYEAPAVTISAHQAQARTWQPYLTAVGSFVAVNGVDISAEVPGIINEIYFESGQVVEQGDPLVTLDDDVDQADLRDNMAQLDLARINYQRQQDLSARRATSELAIDEAHAEFRRAEEAVGRTQAYIDKKHIKAPFEGKLGIRLVSLGEYVSPGTTTLVTLQSMDPLYIRFFLPEQYLHDLYLAQPVRLTVEAYPGEVFEGEINALNSRVDETTHNIEVQATISNLDNRLYPGVFANIEVLLDQQEDIVTVADTAITYSLYGDSVFVVHADETQADDAQDPIIRAYRQYVTVGERRGNEVAILEGLAAGDMVIDSGQLKLSNAARVKVNNEIDLQQFAGLTQ